MTPWSTLNVYGSVQCVFNADRPWLQQSVFNAHLQRSVLLPMIEALVEAPLDDCETHFHACQARENRSPFGM